jgi:hypothetical protein
MDPIAIAHRLIDVAARAEPIEITIDPTCPQGEIENLLEESGVQRGLTRSARQLVDELDGALTIANFDPDTPTPDQYEGRWTFGAAMTIKGQRLSIHGGVLDLVRSIPIVSRVPERVALYLITIDRGEDYLKREQHSGVGWHYHYLDWKERRSNVILCWDTRWKAPAIPSKELRGLFVERHAEVGKTFIAHPRAWGERKRMSMYTACYKDLQSRKIEEYRCAADKAQPVYPLGASLTPRPRVATDNVKAPNGRSSSGKRRA